MKAAGVSMSQAAPVLGYENKSSVSRALVKYKISASDVLKLMALAKVEEISVPGVTIRLKVNSPVQIDALLDVLRDSVLVESAGGYENRKVLLKEVKWREVADYTGYNSKDMARYAWLGERYHLPFFLVLGMVKRFELSPHMVTAGESVLSIVVH